MPVFSQIGAAAQKQDAAKQAPALFDAHSAGL